MASEYDDAMAVVCSIVESQMVWPSKAMLSRDLTRALWILGVNAACPKCNQPMTFTAVAPVPNAPMEWRCTGACVDLGSVGGEPIDEVITIDENGQPSKQVIGPIRDI